MQHTRRLTRVQHMKYYSRASYNRAAHEDGSRAVHEMELVRSTQNITLVSHACLVQVTRQKYKNTCVLPHASVNLEMSCTVICFQPCPVANFTFQKINKRTRNSQLFLSFGHLFIYI